jgi:hypothetical protein
MIELIEFYKKNVFHFLLFMMIGFVIATLDISFRNVVKKVYLNVLKNIETRHGSSVIEGFAKSSVDKLEDNNKQGSDSTNEEGGECPKDCSEVASLQKRLTTLITDATKLKDQVIENNKIIQRQEHTIKILQKSVSDIVDSSKK